MSLKTEVKTKLDSLISFLEHYRIVVAFSGGVDSTLLTFLSNKHSKGMIAITIKSILNPDEEIYDATEFARKNKIPHMILSRNPLESEEFVENPKERCYICKKDIFNEFIKIKDEKGFDIVIDGSNVDDLGDYRPGLKALEDLEVVSPYLKFKINKQEIREISMYYNLDTYSKPSGACFASRIPYYEKITENKLEMIKKGEQYLRGEFNLKQLRVRFHKGRLARIELLKGDIARILDNVNIDKINQKFLEFGFNYVTIDLKGFRSGSLNEVLNYDKNEG